MVRRITSWLICKNAINKEDEELYEYAIWSLYFSIAPIILSLIIGAIIGQIRYGIILCVPLCLIRRYSGGYHAPYGWICILMSVGILLLCLLIQPYLKYNIWLFALTIVASFSLCIFSPIDSMNRPLDCWERKRYKKFTIIVVMACEVVFIFWGILGTDRIACCVATGIILSALLQFPCIPRYIKEKKTIS